MDERTALLAAECRRQEESCLYTSATLYEWLKELRYWRVAFVVLPLILSVVATRKMLLKDPGFEWITGTCALLAGLMPAIYKALNFDVNLDTLVKHANRFKSLQDRFRQAASITAQSGFDVLKEDFDKLMSEMDTARATTAKPPVSAFFEEHRRRSAPGTTISRSTLSVIRP